MRDDDESRLRCGRCRTDRTGFYRWYVLAVLVISYAIYNLDKSILSILIEPIKKDFGLSDTQLSILTALRPPHRSHWPAFHSACSAIG